MGFLKYRTVLLSATVSWIILIVYLFVSVNKIGQHQTELKIHVAVKWAKDLFNSYSGTELGIDDGSYNVTSGCCDTINIVMSADATVLGGLIAAVHSIIKHTDSSHLHFYFILPVSVESHLREWMTVEPLNCVNYTTAVVEDKNFNLQNAKAFFTDYFPSLKGRIIYLDCDVIIQGDISELYKTAVLPNTFGSFSEECHAGSNRIGTNGETRYGGHLNLKNVAVKQLQKDTQTFINPAACTFNTGVFVTSDVDAWRKSNVTGLILGLLHAHKKESILGPQGGNDPVEVAMLAVMYKKITKLDPSWHVRNLGVTTGSRYSEKFLREAKLLHWNGHFKPWSRRGPEQQFWDKYFIKDPRGQFKPIRRS